MHRFAIIATACLLSFHALALTVSGVCVDAQGKGVADAAVWAVQNRKVSVAKADAAGKFKIPDLIAGELSLVARKEGLAIGGVDVRLAGDGDVSITLGEPDALRLRIIDHEFQPLPGARIRNIVVSDQFHIWVDDLIVQGFPSLRSDADGKITVSDLPKGAYVSFSVYHPKFAEESIPYYPVGKDVQQIPLKPGIALQGRIVNEEKQPLARARISVFRMTAGGPRVISEQLSDPEGFFTAVVAPGDYYVAATHEQYVATEPVEARLTRDMTEARVDVVLQTASYALGTVVYEDGTPAGGVQVGYLRDNTLFETSLTEVTGQYRLKIGRGDGLIRVAPPKGYTVIDFSDVLLQGVTLREAPIKPITLIPLPVVKGMVTDANNAPIAQAIIESRETMPPLLLTTDESGAFEIRLDHLPQSYTANFTAEHLLRFAKALFTVDFKTDREVSVQLRDYNPQTQYTNAENTRNKMGGIVDKPAPEWACQEWFNGSAVTRESLKGKVVVLLLWGGFANDPQGEALVKEITMLNELYKDVKDIAFIGVHDAATESADVKSYVERAGVNFPVGRDEESATTFDLYDVTYIPQVVLIDKKGILRFYDTDGRLLELIKVLRREAA